MLARLLCLFLIATAAFAGDFATDWTPGTTQKLTYQMTFLVPVEQKNEMTQEITKIGGEVPTFIIKQNVNVPTQGISISSNEKYLASGLRVISSENLFRLPEAAKAQLGTDTIFIGAEVVNDSLNITSSAPMIKGGKVPLSSNLTTATGVLLTSRAFEPKVGAVHKFNIVSFMSLSGQPFSAYEQVDSVVADTTMTVAAGTFKCFKIRSSVTNRIGYTYYAKEKHRVPILVEVIDPTSSKITARVELLKVE